MADIRIKDLTTEAPTSLTGDFLPIDGGTGTRKLSAYSPTFGGNATVSGTLAVDNTLNANGLVNINNTSYGMVVNGAGISLQTAGSASIRWQDAGVSKWWIYKLSTDSQLYFRDMVNARMQMVMFPGPTSSAALTSIYSGVAIDSTTASSSYITGALVVSGGVGIAGALYSQQNTNGILAGAYFENASTGNAATIRHRLTAGASTCDIEAYGSGHATLANRLRFGTSNGQIDFIPSGVFTAGLNTTGLMVNPLHTNARHIESQITFAANAENYLRISANSGGGIYGGEYGFGLTAAGDPELRINSIHAGTITRVINIRTGTNVVQIPGTTASTSTSTGALVVSGGVGVAGAITAGGTLRVIGSSQIIRVRHDASNIEFTNTAQDAYVTGTVIGNTLQLHGNNGTGLTIGSTGNATFAGNITTGAPSGGTAAAWKLGTVATVSPTSPNRTIEVDIGGTIYYIHAKTTNN